MKDLKISKELMSEVLNYEVDVFLGINKNEIDYTCCRDENEGYIDISINLYEFAFKCKEWARDKYDITISSSLYKNYAKSWNIDKDKSYTAKTEVEVIIKACEFILTKKESK